MTLFCQYKDILGRPGQGAHAQRFAGLALVDLLFTAGGAWLLSKLTKWPLWKAFAVLFALGMLAHWLFCVDTAFMKMLR